MDKLKLYTVSARITLSGLTMEVEARSPQEAITIAEENPDFDTVTAEMIDWTITSVKEDKF